MFPIRQLGKGEGRLKDISIIASNEADLINFSSSLVNNSAFNHILLALTSCESVVSFVYYGTTGEGAVRWIPMQPVAGRRQLKRKVIQWPFPGA